MEKKERYSPLCIYRLLEDKMQTQTLLTVQRVLRGFRQAGGLFNVKADMTSRRKEHLLQAQREIFIVNRKEQEANEQILYSIKRTVSSNGSLYLQDINL